LKPTLTHSILVVDNDPAAVAAISARLAANRYLCFTAACGAQGFAQFQAQPVDLVISDLHMPYGDGVVLAENIRRVSDVPIILISGLKDEFRRRLRSVPDVSFLHKPFPTEDLLRMVAASIASPRELANRGEHDAGPFNR
jgi:DNA-binding response OmpR family regulator